MLLLLFYLIILIYKSKASTLYRDYLVGVSGSLPTGEGGGRGPSLRNRIISRTSPRVASEQAFCSEPQPLERTMLNNGLTHILRARRSEPARRRSIGTYEMLIHPYRCKEQGCDYLSHFASFSPNLRRSPPTFSSTSAES